MDVELYSSTALYISTALQRSTLYILYTLPQIANTKQQLSVCFVRFAQMTCLFEKKEKKRAGYVQDACT